MHEAIPTVTLSLEKVEPKHHPPRDSLHRVPRGRAAHLMRTTLL